MLPLSIPASNVVKNTAKAIMKKNPMASVVVCLILIVTFFLTEIVFTGVIALIFSKSKILQIFFYALLFIILFWPVFMGAIRYFWVLTEQNECKAEAVFYYFSNINRYKRAIKTVLIFGIKILLICFLSMLPCFISSLLDGSWIYNTINFQVPLWTANLQFITDFLKFAGIILTVVFSMKYYLVPVVAVMDESLYVMEAVHISEMISRQSLSAFASLAISFFGWFIVSLLGLPLIYTLPYFLISYVVHCRFAIVNYNLNLERNSR